MKVAIITTLRHNVGDDFVRVGIQHLLRQSLPGAELRIECIHKHAPITVRHGFERIRRERVSRRWDRRLPKWLTRDRIREADLLIQSGAPVYWCHPGAHCAENEWFQPLVRDRYVAFGRRIPFLNLAAGSAQGYHSRGEEFARCELDKAYIREFHGLCQVTTVRDRLAQDILRSLGLEAPMIPCSSIFAVKELGIRPAEGEFVALNYMEGGGHYDWELDLQAARWEEVFRAFYRELRQRERCLFICHNEAEAAAARKIDPEAPIFLSSRFEDYPAIYAKAKYGILNRIHGAFMLASLGKPSFVIGTDTRALMTAEIGLRHAYTNEVDLDRLRAEEKHLQETADSFPARFEAIREKALKDYQEALAPVAARLLARA